MRRPLIIVIINAALLSVALLACKEPFEAELTFDQQNVLVVEGFIHVGGGVTQIKLSRVTPLNHATSLVPENTATVIIEDEGGSSYPLQLTGNGIYKSDNLNLEIIKDYRLRIDVQEARYYSEFVTPVETPPIDSLNWVFDNREVTIFVNTHDPAERTLYYQWDFEEVYEIQSAYMTFYDYVNGQIVDRTTEEIVRLQWCWIYNRNSDFLINSSVQNSTDEIRLFPVVKIPLGSRKIGKRYSINVQQHALSADEYNFLQIIKKNSQNLGTFFDGQPSEVLGNVTEFSGTNRAVGFVGAYTTDSTRITITNDELENWVYVEECDLPTFVTIDTPSPELESLLRFNNIISKRIVDFIVVGIEISPDYCSDCTSHQGAGPKPPFWVAEDLE